MSQGGVIIAEAERLKFRRGLREFYYNCGPHKPLRVVYALTLEKFFNRGYELRDGNVVPVLPSARELPTLHQFKHWYYKERHATHAPLANSANAGDGGDAQSPMDEGLPSS